MRGVPPVWRVVYIAANRMLAETIRDMLSREGFLVTVRPAGVDSGDLLPFEVLVPQSEAQEAHQVICDLLLARLNQPSQAD